MARQYSVIAAFVGASLIALLLGAPSAFAEKTSGLYVGGGVGGSRARDLDKACQTTLPALGATVIECDDKNFAWKAFGGYQFIQYFGVELGYYDFGKGTIKTAGGGEIEFKARGPYAGIVVTAPIINRLSFIGRAGVLHWHTKLNGDALSGITGQSENGFTAAWGIGLEYMFTDSFGLRGEYERFQAVGDDSTTGRTKIDMFSVSGLFRF